MNSNNRLPLAVCWHEGMMLSPQHFQQNHIYWEKQAQSLLTTLPYHWGILSMQIDEGRLQEGIVYFTRLRALMPDGLQVDYDVREHTPLQLNIATEDWTNQDTLKVQITVPIRVPGSACSSSNIQRFNVIEGELAKDDNTGEEEIPIPRLQPIMLLTAGERISEQYTAMPLLEVTKTDGPLYQVSAYCPPMLAIGGDNFIEHQEQGTERLPLQVRLQAVTYKMRQKARQLAGFSDEDEAILGRKISEQHRSWIKAMVQHLVELELLADSHLSSPWQVYQVLARLIGSLCELDASQIPPKLPAYQHNDCGAGLYFAIAYIEQRLDKVNLRYSSLNFEEGQDGIFSITFDKAWNRNKLLVELKPHGHQTQEDLVHWIQNCRIASSKMHKELSIKRLLGASVEQVDYDEVTGISATAGHVLFFIHIDPAYIKLGQPLVMICANRKWKGMQPKRIVLHLPHEMDTDEDAV